MRYVMSDYLAIFLMTIVMIMLALVMRHQRSIFRWFLVGVALASLASIKAMFLPFAILIAACMTLRGFADLRMKGLKALAPAAAIICALALINGSWAIRNIALFGVANDGRISMALSTREIFDHMTPSEHVAAYLWWLRGPGRGIAIRYFPQESWRRFDEDEPDGFYLQGQAVRHEERIQRLLSTEHLTPAVAEVRASWIVIGEILNDWQSYLATMPVMFFRGLWFDDFIIVGFPMLIWVMIGAFQRRRFDILFVFAPGIWSLVVYPAISLNIPRYQYVTVIVLATASGLGVERLFVRWRARKTEIKA
jgi:hypothetical protein